MTKGCCVTLRSEDVNNGKRKEITFRLVLAMSSVFSVPAAR